MKKKPLLTTSPDPTPDTPLAVPAHTGLRGLIDRLIALFTGQPTSSPASHNTPASLAPQNTAVASIHQPETAETLVQTLDQHSVRFHLISREPSKIVYADPYAPHDPSRNITYHWDRDAKKWHLEPGANACALIPDTHSRQLVEVQAGHAKSYGNANGLIVIPPTTEEESALFLLKNMNQQLATRLGNNLLFAASIAPHQKQPLLTHAKKIEHIACDFSRGQEMAKFYGNLSQLLSPMVFAAPYTVGEHTYFWYRAGEHPIGIRLNAVNEMEVLVPDNYSGPELCIDLLRTWLPGNMADGRPHPSTGFSGQQVLFIDSQGRMDMFSNGQQHPNTAHLVPQNPAIKGMLTLSQADLQQHKGYTIEAGEILERENRIASFSHAPIAQVVALPQKVVGKFTAKLAQEEPVIEEQPAQDQIKVTSPDGAPTFELHCTFTEDNCFDENWDSYRATVYVWKKTGIIDLTNEGNPDALIIEVSETGQICLRSGKNKNENGAPLRAVEARVTVQHNGKEYHATLGYKDGATWQEYDKTDGTPFRTPGNDAFMCINGCCSHYSPENQALILDPGINQAVVR